MSKSNLIGQKFGKLTVISYSHEARDKRNSKHHYWNCKCDCGNEKIVDQNCLIHGSTQSCGCIKHGKDLTGQKFNRWTVIKEVESIPRKDRKGIKKAWLCRCDCGTEKVVIQDLLVSGHSKSCGCYNKDLLRERFSKPDSIRKKYRRLYQIWLAMKTRCNNPNDPHHKQYYDRGISICDEWKTFEPFFEWAMNNGYSDDLTIDRIDVNGNYEPDNCRWADSYTQQWNKQNTRYYDIYGVRFRLDDIERLFNIKQGTFTARVTRYGYTPEEAVTIPVTRGGRAKYYYYKSA